MTYVAPVADMAFTMRHVAGLSPELYPDLADGMAEAILEEAGKFAGDRIAPLNQLGDRHGVGFADGRVTMPPGWREVYEEWCAAGWNGLAGSAEHGGQGLPHLMNSACIEMWNAASMAFGLGPLLTMGAAEAVAAHGAPALKATYLEKMVTGVWTGTMNLTEPQAGSDLSQLRSKAVPVGDGSYKITGQKIYITYGEHDLVDNIVHLVLARLPDAPPGTRGISLFLVPKYLVNADGSLGPMNDVRCNGVEHKLGIHASPTCTMVYGDKGGAIGWLVGEENRGLACMFTMMNNARLGVALQGVAIAERATQKAIQYANERRQGRAPGASGESIIADHPDVKRMLMEMKAKTAASRALAYSVAVELDRAHRLTDPDARKAAHERASLLTPVAKAFATDIGSEVASIGVQVHGGMGYVEETGAAQYLRDARIAAIYEGTNGIQAIDLVTRKLPLSEGRRVRAEIERYRETARKMAASNSPAFGHMAARLRSAVDGLDRATDWMLVNLTRAPADALAGATPYLRLFALAAGSSFLAEEALAAHAAAAKGDTDPEHPRRVLRARFFAENVAAVAAGLEATVVEGAGSVTEAELSAAM
jgi:alkylation response protein AidB-like acyl-CoA dehydrogenase